MSELQEDDFPPLARSPFLTAQGREIKRLRAELADAIKERDEAREERDEAHGLIRKWKVNFVDVIDDGEYLYAMTSEARCSMNAADKRAFLAATRKEGGGA